MRHFFLRDHHGFPVACIASIVATPMSGDVVRFDDGPLESDSMVAFTVAVHNPKDTYNKVMGRHIAQARLLKRKNLHYVTPKPNIKANIMHYLLSLNVLHYDALDKPVLVPIRVKEAAAHWLSITEAKARVQAMRDAEAAFTQPTQGEVIMEIPLPGFPGLQLQVRESAPIPCAEALDAYATPPMGNAQPAEEIAEQMAEAINQESEAHFTVDDAATRHREAVAEELASYAPPTPPIGIAVPVFDEYGGDDGDETTHATMRDGLSGTALEALMAEHPPERAVPWTWAGSNVEEAQ